MSIPISERKIDLLSVALYNRQVLEDTILISQCFRWSFISSHKTVLKSTYVGLQQSIIVTVVDK